MNDIFYKPFEYLTQGNQLNNSIQDNDIIQSDQFAFTQPGIGNVVGNFVLVDQSEENLNPDLEPVKATVQIATDEINENDDLNSVQKNKKGYDCAVCGKSFKHQYTLRRHLPTHTDERKYHCNECGKSFRQLSTLSQHRAIHSKVRPYICIFCNKDFSRISSLISHKKTHTDSKPHQCLYCTKSFHQKGNLRNHIFTHTNARPYKCDQCDRGFNQKSNLKSHIDKTHPSLFYKYSCNYCGKMFLKNINLKQHKDSTHPEAITSGQANTSVELTYMKSEDLYRIIYTGKSPFILFRPISSIPVLIRVGLLNSNRITLVPATANDFLEFGQFSIQPKIENENSGHNQKDGLAIGYNVEMKVPVSATLIQNPSGTNNATFQLEIGKNQENNQNGFIVTIGDLNKYVERDVNLADKKLDPISSDSNYGGSKPQFEFLNNQMLRGEADLNANTAGYSSYELTKKNNNFIEILDQI